MLLLQIGNHREVVGPKVLTRCLVYRGLLVVGSWEERSCIQGETNLHNGVAHRGL